MYLFSKDNFDSSELVIFFISVASFTLSTTDIIVNNFLQFLKKLLLPQVKQYLTSSIVNSVTELPYELPSDLRLRIQSLSIYDLKIRK